MNDSVATFIFKSCIFVLPADLTVLCWFL